MAEFHERIIPLVEAVGSETRGAVPLGGLRIGLHLLYLVPGAVGGTETYARRLVHALAERCPATSFLAFCGREAKASLRAERWPANVRVVALPVCCARKPARALAELTLLPAAARTHRLDLLHSLGTTSPLPSPGWLRSTTSSMTISRRPSRPRRARGCGCSSRAARAAPRG